MELVRAMVLGVIIGSLVTITIRLGIIIDLLEKLTK